MLFLEVIGRRHLARLARYMANLARLDCPNKPDSNGEGVVQQVVVKSYPLGKPLVFFDIGANRGLWTESLLRVCSQHERCSVSVHAFEPVDSTMKMLKHTLAAAIETGTVIPVCAGMSNESGPSKISVFGPGCGTNALLTDPQIAALRTEEAFLWTIDLYCERHGISGIDFIKSDVEGHDLFVIRGAWRMLSERRIDIIQFEYNHRWIWSRAYLRDVFEIAASIDYVVGKVTPIGIEFYDLWHPELEKYVEGNYLLCRSDLVNLFRKVEWWNQQSRNRHGGNLVHSY